MNTKATTVIPWQRLLTACAAFLAATFPVLAQSSAPTGATVPDETIELPAYIVGTQGMGYVDANSVSGFKTDQALLDIPQAELVMTQDFLNDVGLLPNHITDAMAYAGVATWFRGGTQGAMIRGSRAITNLTDNVVGPNFWGQDNIDSLEFIKGSLAVIYSGGALTGSIIATTKKPLLHEQNIIDVYANTWGGYGAQIDSTGPIGKIGDLQVSYRVVAEQNNAGLWFNNSYFNQHDLHLTLKFDYHMSSIWVAYDVEQIQTPWNTNGILTPTGDLFTGAGYRNADLYNSGASKVFGLHRVVRIGDLQKISDTWESKLNIILWTENEHGGNLVNTGVNWQTGMLSGIFRENDQPVYDIQTEEDMIGKYTIGKVASTTTFGFNYTLNSSTSEFWTAVNDGPNTYSVPIGPNLGTEIATLHIPQLSAGEYNPPNPAGSIAKSFAFTGYGQDQIDVIPHYVSILAGYSWSWSENITDSNLGQYPTYTSVSESPGVSVWVPRLGFVYHVTKDISVYGIYSKSQSLNTALDINNNRLPNQLITSREIGFKTALANGHVVLNGSVFKITQSNLATFSGLTNAQGVGYYIDSGNVTNEGWDGSVAVAVFDGLQILATQYVGTVKNQLDQWVSPGYGNQTSLFIRYDMPKTSALKGLDFGGGFNRIGSRYITTGGETFPTGFAEPAFFKMHEGTEAELFAEYQITAHINAYVSVENLLNSEYPQGSQSGAIIDAALPRAASFRLTYSF